MTTTLSREGCRLSCFAERIPEGCLGSFDLSFDNSFQFYYEPLFDFSFDLSFAIPYIWMQGCAEMVCNTGMTQYLRVNPQYVWLVPELDYTADTEVISNVEWNVT